MTHASLNAHWALEYIGRPWQSGAQGPHAYDCWSLVRAVQKNVFGRELPIISVNALVQSEVLAAFKDNAEYQHWQRVEIPQDGDCVITKSSPEIAEHVGIWIDVDGGRILQAVYGAGVVAVRPIITQRVIGQHLEYWRYRG